VEVRVLNRSQASELIVLVEAGSFYSKICGTPV